MHSLKREEHALCHLGFVLREGTQRRGNMKSVNYEIYTRDMRKKQTKSLWYISLIFLFLSGRKKRHGHTGGNGKAEKVKTAEGRTENG